MSHLGEYISSPELVIQNGLILILWLSKNEHFLDSNQPAEIFPVPCTRKSGNRVSRNPTPALQCTVHCVAQMGKYQFVCHSKINLDYCSKDRFGP